MLKPTNNESDVELFLQEADANTDQTPTDTNVGTDVQTVNSDTTASNNDGTSQDSGTTTNNATDTTAGTQPVDTTNTNNPPVLDESALEKSLSLIELTKNIRNTILIVEETIRVINIYQQSKEIKALNDIKDVLTYNLNLLTTENKDEVKNSFDKKTKELKKIIDRAFPKSGENNIRKIMTRNLAKKGVK